MNPYKYITRLIVENNGGKIIAYHGGNLDAEMHDETPIFFAETKEGARWYATDRREGGSIYTAELDIKNPFVKENMEQSMEFVEVIKRAGFPMEVVTQPNGSWSIPDKYSEPLRQRTDFYGDNLIDWVYMKEVRDQLKSEGYDAVTGWDALGNTEILIYIPLSSSQIKILSTEKPTVESIEGEIIYKSKDSNAMSIYSYAKKIQKSKVDEGLDMYDDMDKDIDRAIVFMNGLADNLTKKGFTIVSRSEPGYDEDGYLDLGNNVGVVVQLHNRAYVNYINADGHIAMGKDTNNINNIIKDIKEFSQLAKPKDASTTESNTDNSDPSVGQTYLNDTTGNDIVIYKIEDGWVYFHNAGGEQSFRNSDTEEISRFKSLVNRGAFILKSDSANESLGSKLVATWHIKNPSKEERSAGMPDTAKHWKGYIDAAKIPGVTAEVVRSHFADNTAVKVTATTLSDCRKVVKALKNYGIDWIETGDFTSTNQNESK